MPEKGLGTKFAWNSKNVADLTAINGIEIKQGALDTTTHDSPDGYKESIPNGLKEASDVSVAGLFNSADSEGQIAMLADLNASAIRSGAIIFPPATGVTWNFAGFITSLKIGDATVEGLIPFTATVKITGKPNLATAVSAGMSAVALSNSAVIAPAFAIGTFDYVATVLTGVSSITVTPTAAAGVITVNDNVVATGQASSAIQLGAAGSITTITIVVKESDKAPRTYIIRVVRAAA